MQKKMWPQKLLRAIGGLVAAILVIASCDIAWWICDLSREPVYRMPEDQRAKFEGHVRKALNPRPYALQCSAVDVLNAPALSKIAEKSVFVRISYSLRRPYLYNWVQPPNVGFWHQVLVIPENPVKSISIIQLLDAAGFERFLIDYHAKVEFKRDASAVYQAWYESAYSYQMQSNSSFGNDSINNGVICENDHAIWKMGRSDSVPFLWVCSVETEDDGSVKKFRTGVK